MYFFRIRISCFEDDEEVIYVVPEQNADENGVPFEEKFLTQTAEYKQFVKRNAAQIVDGEYEQYFTDAKLDSLTAQRFSELETEGKLTLVDSNSFCVLAGNKGAKKSGCKSVGIIGWIAAVAAALAVGYFAGSGGNGTGLSKEAEISSAVSEEISEE